MYDIELVGASIKLLRDMFALQKDESVVITYDTESNSAVVDATAQAAHALGGKPIVVKTSSPRGVGKAADPDLPLKSLIGLLSSSDIWIEYNNEWLLYSTVFDEAFKNNKSLRYICLVGANPDLLMRNIGRVDIPLLREFLLKIEDITKKAKHIRVTTPAGTDVEFDNEPRRGVFTADGFVRKGEIKMMPGQISWTPKFDTINGTIVIDGTLTPPLGKVSEPVRLKITKDRIVSVEGGAAATAFKSWLDGFKDERMFRLAHLSYGFGPGAKLTGDIVEDERVWGCTEWGIGNIGPMLVPDIPGGIPAPSHSDGICLNSTVYLDGALLLKDGQVVGPTEEIVSLARKLGK